MGIQKSVPQRVDNTAFNALSPVDGDEVYYIVDATNGINWHLRYNAGSASSYKWECVGGPSLSAIVDTAQTMASNQDASYKDLATILKITPTRGGDYIVNWGATLEQSGYVTSNGSVLVNYLGISINAIAPSDTVSIKDSPFSTSPAHTVIKSRVFTGVNAGTDIKQMYKVDVSTFGSNNTGSTWSSRWLNILPIRVS